MCHRHPPPLCTLRWTVINKIKWWRGHFGVIILFVHLCCNKEIDDDDALEHIVVILLLFTLFIELQHFYNALPHCPLHATTIHQNTKLVPCSSSCSALNCNKKKTKMMWENSRIVSSSYSCTVTKQKTMMTCLNMLSSLSSSSHFVLNCNKKNKWWQCMNILVSSPFVL